METWNELTVKVSTEDTERAAAICTMTADMGIYIEDYSDIEQEVWNIAHVDLIEQELLERDRAHSLIHVYIKQEEQAAEAAAFLDERLNAEGIEHETSIAGVNEEDWANNWKQFYHTQHIGKRLIVSPSWEDYKPEEGEIVMNLDPGMAFGTGTHDTTRLCLELLEECVTPQTHILDVGTGSGILSVGGVLLGASSALGVDIDPVAVKVAKENAVLNNVEDKTEFVCGDLTDKVHGKFEIVTANIVADVIIRLLSTVKKGKQPVDFEVENALLKRALGYEIEETNTFITINSKGEKVQKVNKTKKHIAPDATAAIFWLKNRRPDKWRKTNPAYEGKAEIEISKLRAEIKKIEAETARIESQTEKNVVYVQEIVQLTVLAELLAKKYLSSIKRNVLNVEHVSLHVNLMQFIKIRGNNYGKNTNIY